MIQIAIHGAAGRMGRALTQACVEHPQLNLVAAIEHSASTALGVDVGVLAGLEPLGISVTDDLTAALTHADVVVDFTRPQASLTCLTACAAAAKKMVIGTTGFTTAQLATIHAAAQTMPILLAPNMSVGVNLCFKLLELAAQVLDNEFDIEIIEAHHRHKIDAPSGTALQMGKIIAATLGRDLQQDAVYGREGQTGERSPNTIGFATVRGGDIVGDHTALFAGNGERIEITHKASSRMTFANGAMRAAVWLSQQPNGLYDMQDVLGLKPAY